MTTHEDSEYLFKGPCPSCDSSDACAVYDDGHKHCFSCNKTFPPDDDKPAPKVDKRFLQGQPKALDARKILKKTCQKFGYFVAKGRQVASYYWKGKLVAQHTRNAQKEFAWIGKTGHLELWGQHLWQAGGRRLVITEGEIDCMAISQALSNKWPVVSIPSGVSSAPKYIKQNLVFVSSFREIVLAFDDDEPGKECVDQVASLLPPGKVRVMQYEGHKDANEMAQNALAAKIPECVFQAKKYQPDGIVSGGDLWDELMKDPINGLGTPYPLMNKMLMGIAKGELVTFTAGSGIGKTTMVKEILYYYLMEHKQRVGVMALEESVRKTAEDFMSLYLNQPLHIKRDGITKEQYREAYEKVVTPMYFYDHFGSSQIDNLLSKLRYMAVGLECDYIMLDHISIVVSGLDDLGDERKTIDILMTKLRSLVEETGVGILAIVHLKRPGMGKGYNEGRQVSLSDLRGSASIEQLSDTVIALERDQQGENSNRSDVRVLKNRRVGKVGLADSLLYHPDTGRLTAHEFKHESFTGKDF
jgi:twinkle protein